MIRTTSGEDSIHIGIDLGTTYSSIAIYSENEDKNDPIEVLEISNNEFSIPSWVMLLNRGNGIKTYQAGILAKVSGGICLHDSKRLIGETVKHYNEQKSLLPSFTSFIVSTENDEIKMRVEDPLNPSQTESFYPIEVSAMLLRAIYKILRQRIGNKKIGKVVVTVPVSFTPKQKKETIQACKMAGFENISLLYEPTASVIEFDREFHLKDNSKIVVIDCGGDTIDVTCCIFHKDKKRDKDSKIECIRNERDLSLGGNNFDDCLITIILDKIKQYIGDTEFQRLFKVKTCDTKCVRKMKEKRMKKIRNIAEDIKKSFSGNSHCSTIQLDSITEKFEGEITITSDEFESQCIKDKIFEKIEQCVKSVVDSANWKVGDVNYVLAIGGSCSNPFVRKSLSQIFGSDKVVGPYFNSYTCVVKGAAYRAHQLSMDNEDTVVEVMPYTLGLSVANNEFIVFARKGQQLPITFETVISYSGDDSRSIRNSIYKGEGKRINEEGMELVTSVTIEELSPGFKKGEVKLIYKITVNRSGLVEVEIFKKDTGKLLEKMIVFVNLGFDKDMLKKIQQHLEPYFRNSDKF
ncbi:heat shock protein 70kD, putative [Entamoeba dispar SAW760]|uniref:Heat shock protein 70kD, putative n=1 Tax=Entamoeba dispar (strain ATCC PRA-260 / SAW760) TaxID=370354 RepID=B0EBR8_ENTDS|nr:heat shock protein 70kD, putative [Entamoeba dispar SAW760]EDR28080.1 heat shock protein 70kD, putative [Entamoeba dispar SAW760]|eukprot:EDR28080.1 heat shock protein 70kD, putative [Entamoeba dispar SAW760]